MPIYVPSSGYSGDPSLSEIVDRTISSLSGYVRNQEQATHLTVGISDSDLTLQVYDTDNISVGLVEIEDELFWVNAVDKDAGTATVAPYGRGYDTSVIATHGVNVKVLNNPLFPRKRVADAINDTVLSVANNLYAVAYTDITYTPMQASYTLPSAAQDVIGVVQRSWGPTQTWVDVKHWNFNQFAAAGTDTGTQSIELREGLYPGMPVRVTYTTDPLPFTAMSDTLSQTGLSVHARDILVYGAAWRLVSYLDVVRLDLSTAMADNQDQSVTPGSYGAISKTLYAMFAQRLGEERGRLQSLYPSTAYYPQD